MTESRINAVKRVYQGTSLARTSERLLLIREKQRAREPMDPGCPHLDRAALPSPTPPTALLPPSPVFRMKPSCA